MKRKKCFLGAVLGVASSIGTTIFNAKQAKREAKIKVDAANKENARLTRETELASLNNSIEGETDRTNDFSKRFGFKNGGCKRKRNGGIQPTITSGGVAVPLANDTFLLRGKLHEQGGIKIGKGSNAIEAEGNEVVKVNKDNIKILSKEPITETGKAPAKIAIENPNNFEKAFNMQERFKKKHRLNDDGTSYKCGGKRKAFLGATFGFKSTKGLEGAAKTAAKASNFSTGLNLVGDVANMASPIIAGMLAKKELKNLKAPDKPILQNANKLKTNYNVNPQLASVENAESRMHKTIDTNSSSSASALARKEGVSRRSLDARNSLLGQKENIETQLINSDRMNAQQVQNTNVGIINDYSNRKHQFETQKALGNIDINNQMFDSASSAIRDIQQNSMAKKMEKMKLAAILAKNPEQIELFKNMYEKSSNTLDLSSFGCGGKRRIKRKKVA